MTTRIFRIRQRYGRRADDSSSAFGCNPGVTAGALVARKGQRPNLSIRPLPANMDGTHIGGKADAFQTYRPRFPQSRLTEETLSVLPLVTLRFAHPFPLYPPSLIWPAFVRFDQTINGAAVR